MSSEDDPQPTTITDVTVMRALAHPVRLALLEHLGSGGPATATECAEVVSLTPSATSYHLRALAKAGMVEEAPGRGDGRERFWRSAVAGYLVQGGPDEDLDVRAAKAELFDSFLSFEEAKVRRYAARVDTEPKHWQDATYFSDQTLLVTAEELSELTRTVAELIKPYYKRFRTDAPPDARTVSTLFRAFPVDNPLPGEDMK
jgi:DNA-binding transcriptional ArsR family regulator